MPLFSIITVCYNSAKTIERTIQSVLHQSFSDYEYIIVDGKSMDETLAIVDRYRDSFGEKLRVVSEKDNGIYDAMNKGIRMAKGEIVGIINSDDYYMEEALKIVAEAYQADHSDSSHRILYGMIKGVDENGTFDYVEFESHNRLPREMIAHPGCFVTRKTYEDLGAFSPDYRIAADYDFLLRAYRTGDTIFIPIFQILAVFSAGGVSGDFKATFEETMRVRWKNGCISRGYYLRKVLPFSAKERIKGILKWNKQ